jgi:hypothetical protein
VRLPTAVAMLVGVARIAAAQEGWVAASAAQSSHELFSRPAGVTGGIVFPVRERIAFRITYSLLDDSSWRVGRACAGLIPPYRTCPEEPIDDVTSLRGVTFSLVTDVKRWGRIKIALVPTVSGVTIRSTGRGRQTGSSVSSSDAMIGVGGGAEITYRPSSTSPFSLHAGGHFSFLGRLGAAVVDGYTPFQSLGLTRLDVGVSVGRRPRP